MFGQASGIIENPVFFNLFIFLKTFILVLYRANLTIIGLGLLLPGFELPICEYDLALFLSALIPNAHLLCIKKYHQCYRLVFQ